MGYRKQGGRVVRELDSKFGGTKFKSCSYRQLDLFTVVLSSHPRPCL